MHPYFRIESKNIKALNDEQSRELVARLCQAELLAKNLSTTHVTWGGDQRAEDGGVDVRVDISPTDGISGYVPRDATIFQVKAEAFSAAKIAPEMAPKGVLREAITQLSAASGAYVIVSTRDNCSDSSLRTRREAMTACLTKHGLLGKVQVDFYDCRKIADWVERFPAVAIWLRNALDVPLQGWQPYGPWAYAETNVDSEYLLDDRVKVRVSDLEKGLDIRDAINRLRSELREPGVSVRIVGLSGVGKTRLVQALFDKRILTATAELKPQEVIYTDLSHGPTPQPIAMLEALNAAGSDGVVVIDNCGQDIHRQLTEIVKRPSNKLRLVTVEYDIRDDLPEGTSCYQLDGAANEIIAKLLKRRYVSLSDVDIGKIVEFSGGNARVAFALASTCERKGELAQLTDSDLFKRLFLQNNSENDELQRCAEAASLLYSFDVNDVSKSSELAILAGSAEVSITTFFRNIDTLKRRGLVQERGIWRAILPHAISNRLALLAIQKTPTLFLVQGFITEAPERVALSFTRRLGYLHESAVAAKIAQELMAQTALLGDISTFTSIRMQMFTNLAPLNQRAALDAILSASKRATFTDVTNPNRGNVARLLRSLAYEADLFNDAALGLLQFAIVEPEHHKLDSVRDTLKSLFFVHLSGTLASPVQRAGFVRTLIQSTDEAEQTVGLTLLQAAIQTHHFSSHHGFDFGALKRGYGWEPKTVAELQGWYELFIAIAADVGGIPSTLGATTRALLGGSFRSLWTNICMHSQLTGAARKLAPIDGWPDGWVGIRTTMWLDKSKLSAESNASLAALEKELAPQNLSAEIRAKVLSRGDYFADYESNDSTEPPVDRHQRGLEEVKRIGRLAAVDPKILSDLTPYLWSNEVNEKVWYFGFGMGEAAISCLEILTQLRTQIAEASAKRINSNFIRGLITGWGTVNQDGLNAFLEEAVEDGVWGPMFPEMQICIVLSEQSQLRLLKSLFLDRAPCWQYRYLGYGRATDPLTVAQVGALLTALATKPDQGLSVAIDILCMVIHCCDTKDNGYRDELRAFCRTFVSSIEWSALNFDNDNEIHRVQGVIEFAFTAAASDGTASNALERLVKTGRAKARILPDRLGSILLPFFKACPFAALDACYFYDTDGSFDSALRLLSVHMDRHGDSAVSATPEVALIEWCNRSPIDRFIFAGHTCKLFDWSSPGEDSVTGIAEVAMRLLRNAPNRSEIFGIYLERFHPLSWSSSLAAILRQRVTLLDQMRSIGDVTLDALVNEAQTKFKLAVAREEAREETDERMQTGSFE